MNILFVSLGVLRIVCGKMIWLCVKQVPNAYRLHLAFFTKDVGVRAQLVNFFAYIVNLDSRVNGINCPML